jgi:nitrate/nitrite-specific signal transduction histidine kinase
LQLCRHSVKALGHAAEFVLGFLLHFRTRTNTVDIETALQETLQEFKHQTGLPTLSQASVSVP